jgi:hypothetical protein
MTSNTTERNPLMTTTKSAPATAAAAQALADRLAAQERDLADRRRAARLAAELQTVEELLDGEADQLAVARDAAQTAWDRAADDPDVGPDGLFAAWQALRIASAVRARHVAQASARWDALEPLRINGGPAQHRGDTVDYMAGPDAFSFATALENVIRARVEAAAKATENSVTTRVQQAGSDAATKVR